MYLQITSNIQIIITNYQFFHHKEKIKFKVFYKMSEFAEDCYEGNDNGYRTLVR